MKKLNFKKKIKLINYKKINNYKLNNKSINLINIDYKTNKAFEKISKKSNSFIKKSFDISEYIIKSGFSDKLINGPISKKSLYPDILLVPLVAYDKNCNRIGYGGGFYDRYIKKIKKIKKVLTIGLAFSYQKVKKIPIEKNDIKLDFIITEKNK